MRTCLGMKAVSAARLKESERMAKLKGAIRNRLPNSLFGLPKQREYPMEDRTHQTKAEVFATKEQHEGKLSPAQAARIRSKAKRLLGN
jgi:hypothetical protein